MAGPTICFIGTGLMGHPMASNILRAGFDLRAWNRTAAKAASLEPVGATICHSAAEAATGADIVITMLGDGPAVNSVLFEAGVSDALAAGAMVIDMSSIKPAEAKAHASKLAAQGIAHLDAPVSGGTKGAEAGTLAIMAGGDAQRYQRAELVLQAMGRPVLVGADGAGQLSKLVNQSIVAVTIGVVAEAMLLAEQGGADPAAIRNALKGGFADSIILQQHGERMSERNFVPGGVSKFQLKDLNNALEEAHGLGLTLPLAEQIRDRFDDFCENLDGAEKDHAGIYLELRHRNKLD
jgi:2-hydroxy-3-oxopropionate reductase